MADMGVIFTRRGADRVRRREALPAGWPRITVLQRRFELLSSESTGKHSTGKHSTAQLHNKKMAIGTNSKASH